MVFCQIPSKLTEEEKFLQQKYLKLKKKKKLVMQQKIPKSEPQPAHGLQSKLKRTIDGASKTDPKELAKKLLKSGAIQAIKPPEKERQGFKRSKTHSKKLEQADTNKPKYQPFSAAATKWDQELDAAGEAALTGRFGESAPPLPLQEKEAIAREATFREKKRDGKAHYINRDIPNVGNTIYVHGIGINEQMLRSGFAQFGTILNVSLEYNRNCGFITFETIDEANKAIDAMNAQQLNNILLKVTLARKQPIINRSSSNTNQQQNGNGAPDATPAHVSQSPGIPVIPSPHPTAAATTNAISPSITSNNSSKSINNWSAIAASMDHTGASNKDKRSLISYDDLY